VLRVQILIIFFFWFHDIGDYSYVQVCLYGFFSAIWTPWPKVRTTPGTHAARCVSSGSALPAVRAPKAGSSYTHIWLPGTPQLGAISS
jgi:hypothetical protein